MKKDDPLDPLFNQIADLLKIMHEKAAEPFKSGNVELLNRQLHDLENKVAAFKQVTEATLKQQGFDEASIQKQMRIPRSERPKEEVQQLARSEKMRMDSEMLRAGIKLAKADKKAGTKGAEISGKERQKKFKKVGGKKGWKPL